MWGITQTILMNGETYTGKIKESLWRNDEKIIILRGFNLYHVFWLINPFQPSVAFHKKQSSTSFITGNYIRTSGYVQPKKSSYIRRNLFLKEHSCPALL